MVDKTRLELEPQQKNIFFAWLVKNKGNPKKAKRGANSGEEEWLESTPRLEPDLGEPKAGTTGGNGALPVKTPLKKKKRAAANSSI